MNKIPLTLCLIAFSLSTLAQGLNRITIDPSYNGMPLTELIKRIESKHDIDIVYNEGSSIEAYSVNGIQKSFKLLDYFNTLLSGYTSMQADDKTVIILESKYLEQVSRNRRDYIIINSGSASNHILNGKVGDAGNEESIVGANVYIPATKKGTMTNIDGAFSVSVDKNVYLVEIKFVGYDTQKRIVVRSRFGKEKALDAWLFESTKMLEGVEIFAEKQDANVSQQVTGIEKMSMESIKELPTFMGEVDPLKSLTTLPGISSSGDVTAGINVRGGDTGQNYIFQDGAIIYNPTHLFGFFSAFNPDLVSDVTLYKGGGPANMGGRVASVLDISLKNGDKENHHINGGIGFVSSRLSVDGPISKGRSSYAIGVRGSYTDWLLHSTDNIQLQNSSAQFYDATAKIFHKINERNVISVSGYYSYDDFNLSSDSTFAWSTKNLSVLWDHTVSDNVYSELTISNSNYSSQVDNRDQLNPSKYENGINTLGLKYDLYLNQMGDYKYIVGANLAYSVIHPGKEKTEYDRTALYSQKALESAVYVQGDFDLSPKLGVSAGLRLPFYLRMGEDVLFDYDPSVISGRTPQITDTTHYSVGELMSSQIGLEPRVSLRYLINETSSVKMSYYRTYQFLHLISNTTIPTPQDYWIASSDRMRPQIGDQYSIGLFKNFSESKYEVSIEGYYKNVQNTVDYIEGADVTLNQAIETSVVQGNGLAYGVEFQFKKNTGNLDGWLSYTYSRSLRRFENDQPELNINEGDYYSSIYDQPHNLSVVLNYHFNKRVTLSTNFQYNTGTPITIPTSKYSYGGYASVLNYSGRNEYRMPDYHRLDLSLTIKDRQYKDRLITGEWVFSIYNLYSRRNAYSIYFNQYGYAYKMSILGNMFPSISYSFKI